MVYGLAAEDPRAAAAAIALADANPYLSADPHNLPPETPVLIKRTVTNETINGLELSNGIDSGRTISAAFGAEQ